VRADSYLSGLTCALVGCGCWLLSAPLSLLCYPSSNNCLIFHSQPRPHAVLTKASIAVARRYVSSVPLRLKRVRTRTSRVRAAQSTRAASMGVSAPLASNQSW
jgi:hypothetical protein